MKAHIISIGDELLIGQVVNTNAAEIASRLTEAGYEVSGINTVSDNAKALINALDAASVQADVVIASGGLGPTSDDKTKEILTDYFGGELVFNESLFNHISRLFEHRGFPLTESNRQQAYVPNNARLLHNSIGTAAGLSFVKNNRRFFFLPGVPFEMINMMENELIPVLKKHFSNGNRSQRTLLTFGLGESFLAGRIADIENSLPENVSLAYLPSPKRVRLRLTATGDDKSEREKQLQEYTGRIRDRIPELVFGEGDMELEEVAGQLLKDKQMTLSTAESCTGGTIAQLITSVPGSSDYFKGSVVAYSNEIKENVLNVSGQKLQDFGAVSEAVVVQMAENCRRLMNTDVAISTSGVAGPGGGTKEKPVGTVWIAVAFRDKTVSRRVNFGKDRQRNIIRSASYALNMLRLELLKEAFAPRKS